MELLAAVRCAQEATEYRAAFHASLRRISALQHTVLRQGSALARLQKKCDEAQRGRRAAELRLEAEELACRERAASDAAAVAEQERQVELWRERHRRDIERLRREHDQAVDRLEQHLMQHAAAVDWMSASMSPKSEACGGSGTSSSSSSSSVIPEEWQPYRERRQPDRAAAPESGSAASLRTAAGEQPPSDKTAHHAAAAESCPPPPARTKPRQQHRAHRRPLHTPPPDAADAASDGLAWSSLD
eukprot:TRINITY_DN12517_c0_g1_i1.p3 TRINITY_DN12517_c0_g1~~TRINITY_DN12517_c0_g1_i1.p3  ORF type:complete len:244 (+),score=84.08 TRINITY_DN12517_c0_g1_i1:74-805(+)